MKLKKLADLTPGEYSKVFLVASGPSVNDFDLTKKACADFWAMNGSIYLFSDVNVQPDLYLCDDPNFALAKLDAIILALKLCKRVALSYEVIKVVLDQAEDLLKGQTIYLLEKVNRINGVKQLSDRKFAWKVRKDKDLVSDYSLLKSRPNTWGFSKNLVKGYYSARTIPYVGLQIAYCLGYQCVFLVGVDLTNTHSRFYESGEKAQPSSLDEHYNRHIYPNFRLMSEKIMSDKFKVYNLSGNSRLPNSLIPKITNLQLLELLDS